MLLTERWLTCCRVWLAVPADNGIGEAGAVAVAKALESGRCLLTSLDLGCECAHRGGALLGGGWESPEREGEREREKERGRERETERESETETETERQRQR